MEEALQDILINSCPLYTTKNIIADIYTDTIFEAKQVMGMENDRRGNDDVRNF